MSDPKPVIEVRNLTVRYGEKPAVDRVSFSVDPGAVYALLGRNGAGKSTIVRCLLGFQKSDEGASLLFGEDAWTHRARLMKRVGIVPEIPDAPTEMSPRQIIRFLGRIHDEWDGPGLEERLLRFKVPIDISFGRLSKGQQRQALLSMALASQPRVLILDDPTLGLDVVARRELFEVLIDELADRGTTVLVTTHDLAGIEGIADSVGVLRDGQLVLDEPVQGLKDRYRRIRYTIVGTDDGLRGGPFETIGLQRLGSGAEAIVTNFDETRMEEFRAMKHVGDVDVLPLSLEDVFIAVSREIERSST